MNKQAKIIIGVVVVILIGLTFWFVNSFDNQPEVTNFKECVEADYLVMESYPRRCRTPEGEVFTEEIEDPVNSEEIYQEKAEKWIKEEASTYIYDGEDLKFIESRGLDLVDCEECYEYEFEFISRHGGYGDREGKAVTQALTPHTIVVTIEEGEVTKVIIDGKFDEMNEKFLVENQEDVFIFECPSGDDIQLNYNSDNDMATVLFQGSTYNLSRARSASGARYANEDESVIFWEHQDKAIMEIEGEKFGECERKN